MLVEFNPKEARGRTKIFNPKMSLKGGDELVDWGDRCSKNEDVVYIYKNIERSCSEEVKRRVCLGPVKTEGEKSPGEFAKPLPGGLFEAIEGFPELTNMVRIARMMKTGRLLHIYELG